MRNRRSGSRETENADLFSTSLIFGNVGGGPAAQQQSSSTNAFSAGAPYLLDGSGGSRRSPGGSLKQSPVQFNGESYPRGAQYPTSGGVKSGRSRPPITSILEKQARGGSALGRSMDFDSNRSPHNAMDRTHVSMSGVNTSMHSEGGMGMGMGMGMGDISFASEGSQAFGSYSGGFNVDSSSRRGPGKGRMQTPYARKSRLGYDEDEEEGEGEGELDRTGPSSNGATPLWSREGLANSGASSGSRGYGSGNVGRYDRADTLSGGRSNSTGIGSSRAYGQQSNMMLFGSGPSSENSRGGARQDSMAGSIEVFENLDASWLMWVIVSGVPLSATSSSSSVSKVLMRMQAFGTVLAHSVSAGNWMFVKFSTPFEAERAASECLTFLGSGLDSHVMLSCTQLTAALARTLDLQIDSSGALTRGQGAGQGVTSSPFPTSRHTESQSRQERKPEGGLDLTGNLSAREGTVGAELYLRPAKKRTGNICNRLIEYIFSY